MSDEPERVRPDWSVAWAVLRRSAMTAGVATATVLVLLPLLMRGGCL